MPLDTRLSGSVRAASIFVLVAAAFAQTPVMGQAPPPPPLKLGTFEEEQPNPPPKPTKLTVLKNYTSNDKFGATSVKPDPDAPSPKLSVGDSKSTKKPEAAPLPAPPSRSTPPTKLSPSASSADQVKAPPKAAPSLIPPKPSLYKIESESDLPGVEAMVDSKKAEPPAAVPPTRPNSISPPKPALGGERPTLKLSAPPVAEEKKASEKPAVSGREVKPPAIGTSSETKKVEKKEPELKKTTVAVPPPPVSEEVSKPAGKPTSSGFDLKPPSFATTSDRQKSEKKVSEPVKAPSSVAPPPVAASKPEQMPPSGQPTTEGARKILAAAQASATRTSRPVELKEPEFKPEEARPIPAPRKGFRRDVWSEDRWPVDGSPRPSRPEPVAKPQETRESRESLGEAPVIPAPPPSSVDPNNPPVIAESGPRTRRAAKPREEIIQASDAVPAQITILKQPEPIAPEQPLARPEPPVRREVFELVKPRPMQYDVIRANGSSSESGVETAGGTYDSNGSVRQVGGEDGQPKVVSYPVRKWVVTGWETFAELSKRQYGSDEHAAALARFNRSTLKPTQRLTPGVSVRIPPLEVLNREAALAAGRAPAEGGLVGKVLPPLQDGAFNKSPVIAESESRPRKSFSNPRPLAGNAGAMQSRSVSNENNGDPSPIPAPKQPEARNTYTVSQPGMTLYKVAAQKLGDGTKAQSIYELNRDVLASQRGELRVGLTLRLPEDGMIR